MELPTNPNDEFPFEIERKIGQGAMGAVFLAREPNLDRKVALKMLRPDFLDRLSADAAREASRRFLQEARASAAFSHPGIVTIHRIGSVDGLSYIAMEWIDGDDLQSLIRQHAPLEVSEVAEIGVQLLEALEAAHAHDIIHRDVKPGNVMVEADCQVKLTDFGIAHVKDSELVKTQAGEVMGTPVYASPEQLLERGIDVRADLFSVGVILYEMLTGELPFDGSTVASVATKIVNDEPTRVSQKNPAVPDKLERLIHRAMAKSPESRFSSADQMGSFLEQWAPDPSSTLQSPSWAEAMTAPTVGDPEAAEASDETTAQTPTRVVEGSGPLEMAIRTVVDWPSESLGDSATEPLLEKLLETPLHADPFAGAVRMGNSLFFIYQGLIFASVDLERRSVGDHVYEQLPASTPATLYPVPDALDDRCIPHLASILYEPDRLHEQLDSSFTDIPQLVRRLREQDFDGAVRLREGAELAYLFFDRGADLMEVFSSGWEPDPVDHLWPSWIDDRSVTVDVEQRRTHFPAVTYRRELQNRPFHISPASEGREVDSTASSSTVGLRYTGWNVEPVEQETERTPGRDSTIWRDLYQSAPPYRLLRWMLSRLPAHMEERKRFDAWKYLTHWTAEITEATLYHELPRPNSRETEFFDLVTRDADGKVLHLVRQVSQLTPSRLDQFITDVKAAKHARNDRGDIGAAILMAESHDEEFLEAYHNATTDIASWMASMTESITGYEGFVRTGLRRGFHLLPVLRTDNGFEPILEPDA